MRILIYTHEFLPWSGGVATYNLELAQGLAGRGHDVMVLAPKYTDDGAASQSRLYRVWRPFPNKGFKPYRILASMTSLVVAWLRFRPDVIFATNGGSQRCIALVSLLLPMPFVLVVHGAEIISLVATGGWLRLYRGLIRRGFRRAKAILAVSQSTRELIVSRLPEVGEKTLVVYHGIAVPAEEHSEQQQVNELETRLGLASEDKVLLTVARLVPGKGQDQVIRALPKVLQTVSNVKYLMVGSGECDGELKTLANIEGVESAVRFAGNVPRDQVWSYYQMCDLFVMPSQAEAFGITFIEAAGFGKPVIGGRQGGMVEVIDDGVTGLLVDPNSPDEIADAILRILSCPETGRRMGEQARKRFEARFSVQVMVEETLKVVAQQVTDAN